MSVYRMMCVCVQVDDVVAVGMISRASAALNHSEPLETRMMCEA